MILEKSRDLKHPGNYFRVEINPPIRVKVRQKNKWNKLRMCIRYRRKTFKLINSVRVFKDVSESWQDILSQWSFISWVAIILTLLVQCF